MSLRAMYYGEYFLQGSPKTLMLKGVGSGVLFMFYFMTNTEIKSSTISTSIFTLLVLNWYRSDIYEVFEYGNLFIILITIPFFWIGILSYYYKMDTA